MTTVLIVDDSRVSRMMLQSYAQKLQPDWRYLEAASGDEAIQVAEGEAIDLAIFDVNMPGISGLDAAAALRQSQPQTSIVILTANVQQSTRDKAQELGVHFVQKPVTADSTAHILSLLGASHV